MKTKIHFGYTENVVPPRCRKPRRTEFDDGVLKLSIREVTGAEAPVAIVARPPAGEGSLCEITYRFFAGKLWTSMRVISARPSSFSAGQKDWGYPPIPEEISLVERSNLPFKLGFDHAKYRTKAETIAILRKQASEILIVDGVVHRTAGEPRYVVMTFGGTCVTDNDSFNPNISRSAYFSLLQEDEALAYGTKVAENRGDTKSLPMTLGGMYSYEVLIREAIKVNAGRKAVASA